MIKRVVLSITIFISITIDSFSMSAIFDYSPCSIYAGDNTQKEGSINLTDNNGYGLTDRMGDFYFSKLSLSIISNPEKLDIPYTDNRYASYGIFFDVMHKEMDLEPVDIRYLENGGKTHVVTYAFGYSYRLFLYKTTEGLTIGLGVGLATTYFYKNNFSEKTGCENTAPVFKAGMGYRIKTTDALFIDIGIEIISPALTYHKVEGDGYASFKHGGIYPYIGICY